jgi:hypothetical protein
MVSAWWAVLAFFLGGSAGMVLMALMAMSAPTVEDGGTPMDRRGVTPDATA